MLEKPFIQLPYKKGIEIIPQEGIISVSSINKRLHFILDNGQTRAIRGNMCELEKILTSTSLKRCHQRFIVNLHKIREVNKIGNYFVMINNMKIPVSRRYKKAALFELDNICVKMYI